ncbi:MAG: hypothetical protein ABIB47_02520 [Candidatus Woesearchaeota archaeon]
MAKSTKKSKKTWIRIVAPKEFNSIELGESYVYSPEDLIGKNLKANLSTLLRDIRRQNANLSFKVHEVSGNHVITKIISFEILPAHVKRMVRTMKDRLDDSFIVPSKDKLKIRIKPIILTRSKTSNSVLTLIRKATREKLGKFASEHSFSEIINIVITGQLQKQIKSELKKIHPLSIFEIRKVELANR